jgi:hypothetical protein
MSTTPITQSDIKVPFPSGKTDATVVGASITAYEGVWQLLEVHAPSTGEQRARILNGQASPYEFGFSIEMKDGVMSSILYGRKVKV